MKFVVTYTERKTAVCDTVSIKAAEAWAERLMMRLGGFEDAKLLSICELKAGSDAPDKPPTPFNRPPSGTPGAGQFKRAA